MTNADSRVDPWLTEPAVAALSGALSAVVPSGHVALIGAGADRWLQRLGPRAEVLTELFDSPSADGVEASRFAVAAVTAPDALPDTAEGEGAFVAALTGLADVVLLATVSPAGATAGHGRWPAYWAARFEEHDWTFPDLVRPLIWDDSQLAPDVKEGALLFVAPAVALADRSPAVGFPRGSAAVLHPNRLTETRRAYEARLASHVQAAEASLSELESRLQAEIDRFKIEHRRHAVRIEALEARMAVTEHRWAEVVSTMLRSPVRTTADALLRRFFSARGGRQQEQPPDPAVAALFDADYYVRQNPDAAEAPLRHYLEMGEAQGRRPSLYFDPVFYRSHNPDVAQSGMSPLRHYALYGGYEGRAASEQFDTGWYVATHPDVLMSGLHPLLHFLRIGRTEGYVSTRD